MSTDIEQNARNANAFLRIVGMRDAAKWLQMPVQERPRRPSKLARNPKTCRCKFYKTCDACKSK